MNAITAVDARDPRAKQDQARWDELKSARSHHEHMWEDIARLIRPQRGGFTTTSPNTQREMEKPLSSAPIHAQSRFSANLYSTLTNPANRWFGFSTNDPDMNKWHPAKLWMDTVTDRVLASFLPGTSPFYTAATQVFGDLASFGNACQYDEIVPDERKIMDVTVSLAEVCFDVDAFGRVVEVVRRYYLSAEQAIMAFRKPSDMLPPKLHELAEKGDRTKYAFFQRVGRNMTFTKGKLGPSGKRWYSRSSCEIDQTLIRVAGFDEMPFYAPRWEVDSGEVYGTGPGFVALASTRTHHRMTEAIIRAAQYAADPTLLAPDKSDWPLNGKIRPGAVVYGAVDMQGRPLLRALDRMGQINLPLAERQYLDAQINDAFNKSLLSMANRSGMTPIEVAQISEEEIRAMGPNLGRAQEEYLAPKVARRFDMLWRAGQIPPPPAEMAGLELTVEYRSAAAAAQRSVEGNAIARVLQDLAPLAALSPSAAERISDRLSVDDNMELLIEARGAPARMATSREGADAAGQGRAQAQQAMQAMQTAQAGAGVMKDVAGAQAAMAGAQGGGM